MASYPAFENTAQDKGVDLHRRQLKTLQVNIGKLCNQACHHCHVEAGPKKVKENMGEEGVNQLLRLIDQSPTIETVDITGGAPELNPYFKEFVVQLRKRGLKVIDRCNLTVLFEPGQEETADFLANYKVEVVASLPCYSKKNVEKQRGRGVFGKSIDGLKKLNSLGYAKEGSGLVLNLVYNPLDASLPPEQSKLQLDYKKELKELFNIEFNSLYTITNMPIKRFLWDLEKQGKYDEYMHLLINSFNPSAASEVMCRDIVSVSWDGALFDCDFNQMLELPIQGEVKTIFDIENFDEISKKPIVFKEHCYGCTAGAGSSCGGSLI